MHSARNRWAGSRHSPSPQGSSRGRGWNDSPPSRSPFGSERGGGGAPRRAVSDWMAPNGRGTNDTSGWTASPTPQIRLVAGEGAWKEGQHIVGQSNSRLEKELFGDPADPQKTHTGLNFEKYDDIPVEATGANVPDPILSFETAPLDPLLLENIKLARYTTPTPVQKYSIPVVLTSKSDLMGCVDLLNVIS